MSAKNNSYTLDLIHFERMYRLSLRSITLKKLNTRRKVAATYISKLESNPHCHQIHSCDWYILRQWQIRLGVCEDILEDVRVRDKTIRGNPAHIKEFEQFLRGKLQDITYNNLLLRKKTADFYIKRLSRWKYLDGYPEWVELQEWNIRMKVYKQLIKKFNA